MYFHNVTNTGVRGGRIRIRCEEGGGVTIRGLRTWNVQFDVLTNEALTAFEGYDPRDVSIGVEASPNAANAAWAGSIVTLSGVPDYRDYASALLSNWRCQQDVRIINSAAGSATRMVPDRSPSTTTAAAPAHGGRVFHRVNVQVLTTEGDGIEGPGYILQIRITGLALIQLRQTQRIMLLTNLAGEPIQPLLMLTEIFPFRKS